MHDRIQESVGSLHGTSQLQIKAGIFGNDSPKTVSKVLPIDERRYVDTKFELPFSKAPTMLDRNYEDTKIDYEKARFDNN